MVKDLNWQEYHHATVDDDGDSHTSSVTAAVYSKENGDVEVVTVGGSRKLEAGEVVVKHPADNYVDVVSPEAWKNAEYESDSGSGGDNSPKPAPAQNVRK